VPLALDHHEIMGGWVGQFVFLFLCWTWVS
jgi:hypothetical protein